MKIIRYLCLMMAVCSIFAACFFPRYFVEKPLVSDQDIHMVSYETELKNLGMALPVPLSITLSWGHQYVISIIVFCVTTLVLVLMEIRSVEDYFAYPVYCLTIFAGLGFTVCMAMSLVLPFLTMLAQLGGAG